MAKYGIFQPVHAEIYDDLIASDRDNWMRFLAEAKISGEGLTQTGDIKIDWHQMDLVEAMGWRATGYDMRAGDWLGRAIVPVAEEPPEHPA